MEETNNKNSLKKLLDRLQEESWHLELLVSGFTIFGLFYAREPVADAFQKALIEGDILKDLYQIVFIAIDILIFNLIIHLVLRSLWIGALGLRSVSGDVDIYKLNYTKRFTNFLNKKIGSFDNYIEKLEKICSIIFAISFLLIFYVAAFFIVAQMMRLIDYIASPNIGLTIIILLGIGALLTFFDYVSQGLLKKNRWVAAVYFPFYWVFSYLTLSFLYRPLYYNLLDNKFGRRVSSLLVPFYIAVLIISSLYKEQSGFIADSVSSNATIASSRNYEDVVEEEFYISSLAIQSKVISDSYIKVKVPLTSRLEERILEFNESLKPYYDNNKYKSDISIGFSSNNSSIKINTDSLHQEYLKTFEKAYSIKIDSVLCKPDFVIAKENERLSIVTYIGTRNLAEGKHILVYSRRKHPGTDSVVIIKKIPFWYYKN